MLLDGVVRVRDLLHLEFPTRLKWAMLAAGQTAVGLSVAARLSRNAVWFIEHEGRMPGLDAVERLARVLGVSPCDLAYGIPGPPAGSDVSRAAGVGERLRSARVQAGLNRHALGERSGTTGQSIANIEAGGQMPGIGTVELLADALGVSPCWLAFGDGPVCGSVASGPIGPMSLQEADIRAKLIDPALYARCWTEDHMSREQTLGAVVIAGGAPRRTGGRADLVLRIRLNPHSQPIAVAVLEAKKETLPPGHGLDQAKAYAAASARHHVLFVYSTNGHMFVEYDRVTGQTSPPRPMTEFPTPAELQARYERHLGVPLSDPAAKPLLIPYPGGEGQRRYYQDAAIRAVLEKIAQGAVAQDGKPPRALLSLATGAGKTFIAVHLLQRLSDAGQLRRALFVCDRDELRTPALQAFQAVFATNAQEVYETAAGRNNAQNARVHIATYQTLGLDDTASFLLRHYPEDHFSHVVIDECHRSAWGKWSVVLARNAKAVQIGLTAAPRILEYEEDRPKAREDREITAHNAKYFGPAVYEYSLAQAMEDGYLAACQIELLQVNLDATGLTAAETVLRDPTDAITGRLLTAAEINDYYLKNDFESELLLPDRVAAMCADLFARLQAGDPERGPEQKTIIFCARDQHAAAVADQLNNLYADWCAARGVERKEPYAFKCTADSGGSKLVQDLRGATRSHFIATTVELLTTGVDVPVVRNIVFFRYLESPISFHQMLGRGTRIDEPTGKLRFTVYDYTAATRLFTQDFVTRARTATDGQGAREPETAYGSKRVPAPPPPPVRVEGFEVHVSSLGRYVVTALGGRAMPIPLEDYKKGLAAQLIEECPSVEIFRSRWVAAAERRDLLDRLVGAGYSPAVVRMLQEMEDYDLFDVLGDLGYGISPRTRADRVGAFRYKNAAWLEAMPLPAANTIRALTRQFIPDGTEGLENPRIWQTPEVKSAGGQRVLRAVGEPAAILRETEVRMFAP